MERLSGNTAQNGRGASVFVNPMWTRSASFALLAAMAVVALTGCGQIRTLPEARVERRTVQKKSADMVSAEIRIGVGSLKMQGGAKDLLEAVFTNNVNGWKPDVRYDESSFRGRLEVQDSLRSGSGSYTNDWDLSLNNSVPLDLKIAMGVGSNRLDLSQLALRSLRIDVGVGEAVVNLSGAYKHDVNVEIHGGVGAAEVRLPAGIGVKADAKGGIGGISARNPREKDGAYYNEAWGKSAVRMTVEVRGGVGEIRLSVD